MKFSVFTASTPDWTPSEAAETLAAQGWDGIEWRIVDDRPADGAEVPAERSFWAGNNSTWQFTGIRDQVGEIARITDDAGLEFSGIGGYSRPPTTTTSRRCSGDRRTRCRAGPGHDAEHGPRRNAPARPTPSCSTAPAPTSSGSAERAAELGVKALVELHHETITPSASAALRLIDGLDPAHVGVIHDLGNLVDRGARGPPRRVRTARRRTSRTSTSRTPAGSTPATPGRRVARSGGTSGRRCATGRPVSEYLTRPPRGRVRRMGDHRGLLHRPAARDPHRRRPGVPALARPGVGMTDRRPGIVHLGLGAFPRSHLAWYTAHTSGEPWGIIAFTGRSPAAAARAGRAGLPVHAGHPSRRPATAPSWSTRSWPPTRAATTRPGGRWSRPPRRRRHADGHRGGLPARVGRAGAAGRGAPRPPCRWRRAHRAGQSRQPDRTTAAVLRDAVLAAVDGRRPARLDRGERRVPELDGRPDHARDHRRRRRDAVANCRGALAGRPGPRRHRAVRRVGARGRLRRHRPTRVGDGRRPVRRRPHPVRAAEALAAERLALAARLPRAAARPRDGRRGHGRPGLPHGRSSSCGTRPPLELPLPDGRGHRRARGPASSGSPTRASGTRCGRSRPAARRSCPSASSTSLRHRLARDPSAGIGTGAATALAAWWLHVTEQPDLVDDPGAPGPDSDVHDVLAVVAPELDTTPVVAAVTAAADRIRTAAARARERSNGGVHA